MLLNYFDMILACTGHRPNKIDNDYTYTSVKSTYIRSEMTLILLSHLQIDANLKIISGMALGVDTIWAKLAIDMKIPLIAAIPFKGQSLIWPETSQRIYEDILSRASSIYLTNDKAYTDYIGYKRTSVKTYTKPGAVTMMHLRNQWMVDSCNKLVAVYNGDKFGGTYNCINYAKLVKKEIIYINI